MCEIALYFEEFAIDSRVITMVEVTQEDEETPHVHGLGLAR